MEEKYLKIDKKVDKIVRGASKYMVNLEKFEIKNEIFKAYFYARQAHE
jgi:hypothetical protein